MQNDQISILNQRLLQFSQYEDEPSTDGTSRMRIRIDFLERQNSEYIEKVARLENELALQRQNIANNVFTDYSENYQQASVAFSSKKIQKLEIERLKLIESNDYMQEKLHKVQFAYNQIKEQLDGNIARYESLLMKVKDNEDDKTKYVMHAKKLDEQLKSLNNNYMIL